VVGSEEYAVILHPVQCLPAPGRVSVSGHQDIIHSQRGYQGVYFGKKTNAARHNLTVRSRRAGGPGRQRVFADAAFASLPSAGAFARPRHLLFDD
jgi:hypothetical protein